MWEEAPTETCYERERRKVVEVKGSGVGANAENILWAHPNGGTELPQQPRENGEIRSWLRACAASYFAARRALGAAYERIEGLEEENRRLQANLAHESREYDKLEKAAREVAYECHPRVTLRRALEAR